MTTTTTNTKQRITMATIKSFVRKNEGKIYIKVSSKFDGMTDCVERLDNEFMLAKKTSRDTKYTFGISGAWFVGQSRDYFQAFENENFAGYRVCNACGSFFIAIKK